MKKKNEIEKYIKNIKEFRNYFTLSEDDYSNQELFDVLKKCNFEYEEAFVLLIDQKEY